MHQYALWLALEAEGLGANLQHWNPVPDLRIRSEYDLPELWVLRAQLVFGAKEEEAGEKTTKPLGERLKVVGYEEEKVNGA